MFYSPSSYEAIHVPPDMAPITPSDDGRLDAVKASVTDALGITWTAATAGTAGNSLDVTYADSSGAAISAAYSAPTITITAPILGKAAAGTIDAGAGEVVLTAETIGSAANGIVVNFVKRVTIAALPLSVSTSTDGRIINVYMATDATTDVFASLTTALTGNNNDLVYTSLLEGAYGNTITIAYLDPATASQSLRVEVDNRAIKVHLATGAGTKQVETATAAGTITTSGNATVTTTAAFIPGSPLTTTFAVEEDDTAATWAQKARVALINDRRISAYVDISGTTTAIVGTRKVAAANDATFNFALADDDSEGITEAASSANTTAGVAPAITSTAAQIKAALDANVTVAALVSIANAGGNDGTGVVTALAATALANGKHADCTSTVAQIVTAIDGDATAGAIVDAAGTGTTSTVVNANYSATLSGGVDAASVSLGEIIGAVAADAGAAAQIKGSVDVKRADYNPTATEWDALGGAIPYSLAGGLAGQWDIEQGFARGIYVEVGGDVVLKTMNGDERTIALPDNGVLDIAFTSVESTGTTATGIFGRA
jgi:hypothetical protein